MVLCVLAFAFFRVRWSALVGRHGRIDCCIGHSVGWLVGW